MQTIAVIDYGASNLRSVGKALEYVADRHSRISVCEEAVQLRRADKVVFPGQGAMGQCMRSIKEMGLEEALRDCIVTKPFLGICLGLQTLMEESEEDNGTRGLGIIEGRVRRFPGGALDEQGRPYKIPHMGWNRVSQQTPHELWDGIETGERFYFVHSYYVEPVRKADLAGSSDYILSFAAAVARERFFATQFHPEKSQRPGLRLLSNFLRWEP